MLGTSHKYFTLLSLDFRMNYMPMMKGRSWFCVGHQVELVGTSYQSLTESSVDNSNMNHIMGIKLRKFDIQIITYL